MIAELLSAPDVRQERDLFIKHLLDLAARKEKAPTEPADAEWPEADAGQLRALALELQREKEDDEKPDTVSAAAKADGAYVPTAPFTCVLQSVLEDRYRHKGWVVADESKRGLAATNVAVTDERLSPAAGKAKGLAIGGMEDGEDIRFITDGVTAVFGRVFGGKADFNSSPARTANLGPKSRVVLFGDWASGVTRAQALANAIAGELTSERALPTQHLVHLGDTYYAGRRSEYERRFLPYWPQGGNAVATHWSLNGNHDMYSGGKGYFETLLKHPQFKAHLDAQGRPSSFFLLQNDHWQIFGLDSAYHSPQLTGMDGAIDKAQADFVANNIDGNRGVILLTHHQLFSARPKEGQSNQIREALRTRGVWPKITGWIWGHEHRCTLYQPTWTRARYGLPFAMCLGNSGIPTVKDNGAFDQAAVDWEYAESFKSGTRTFMNFAFATIAFDDATPNLVKVAVFGPDGNLAKETSFSRSAA